MWQMTISCFIRVQPPKQKVTTEPPVAMVAGHSDQMANTGHWPASAFEALLGLGKHLKLHGKNKKKQFHSWMAIRPVRSGRILELQTLINLTAELYYRLHLAVYRGTSLQYG